MADSGQHKDLECRPQECPIREAQGNDGGRAIGAMNGKWAFLLKLVLITTPAAWAIFVTVDLPWRVWVTKTTFASVETHKHLGDLTNKLDQYITAREADYRAMDKRLDALPTPEWRKRVEDLEGWERQNRADHAQILIALEAIKAKLNIPKQPTPQDSGVRLPMNHREDRNEQQTALRGGDDPGSGSPRG